ncbi:carboxypeptidase-like regulatory domain-containing protein [Phycicoccus sonneratiae]|uniref:alpha-amylase n=1 Tax=Phycicoccus sonneratiae TaxID=2807628 RepID=A0ABS2CIX1_9MICO|nr:carboxypeptidase-like regulatory domain-containing protein [Phycicoccus sonneraticus]MBM6399830.1 carboxypeptidase regulatory-like domain-containing protein [Phycicoccus sonneraticus]
MTWGGGRRTAHGIGVAAIVGGLLVGTGAGAASAAPSEGYADWTLSGSGGAYTATAADLATGFPAVSLTSTSAAPASVGTGTTTWVPAGTGFGAAFGSSRGREYLGLRPAANNATSPSDTTLTFAAPTPVGGWGLALGDLEAETIEVTGTDPDGNPVSGAQLGLVEAFSFCDASPRSAACSGQSAPYDLPTATVLADRVTATDPRCPSDPTTCDTVGETVWLSPTVPLGSLTIRSRWDQGLPTYLLWLATAEHAVSGTVTAPCEADGSGIDVEVLDPADDVVATATTTTGGTWQVSGLLARDDWRVRVVPPAGTAPSGAATTPVDLSAGDVTGVDSTLTSVRPVSGSVTDPDGAPLAGASVVLQSGTTTLGPVTTGADGTFEVPGVPAGDWEAVVSAPEGYLDPDPVDLTVGCGDVALDAIALEAAPTSTPTPTTTTPAPSTSGPAPTTTAPTAPPTAPPAVTGPLAATGADPLPPLAHAGALVLAGVGLLGWSRRRPRRTH